MQPRTSRLNWQTTNNIASSSTNKDNDQRLITSTEDSQFTWLWWWLPLRLSKRQSMSPQTVLSRTTLTWTIAIYRLVTPVITLNSRNPRHPSYLIHQRLKVTKVSPMIQRSSSLWNTEDLTNISETSRELVKTTTGRCNSTRISRNCYHNY